MTEQEVRDFLAIQNKLILRPFSWSPQIGGHTPPWLVFESAIQVNGTVLEGFLFRARFQDAKAISKANSTLNISSSFSVAIFSPDRERIVAIDSGRYVEHKNRVGLGMPYFQQVISGYTHRHIWTGEYGYAEPINPSILEIVDLLKTFAAECNLTYAGEIAHPLRGTQKALPL